MYKDAASWQDVMFCSEHNVDCGLYSQIEEYAKIPKHDLVARRDCLTNLLSLCNTGISKNVLNSLNMRINYFNQIINMYNTGILYKDHNPQIYNKSEVISLLTPKKAHQKLIYPNDKTFYGSQINDIWGDAYLDILDPAHRNLIFWKHVWLNSGSRIPFFTALEEYMMSPDTPCIFFYNEHEIEKRKATIFDNRLFMGGYPVASPDVVDDSNQTMFVINAKNELIIDFSSKHIRHISLSSGQAVLGGGLMVIKNGYLQEISNSSGHYLFNTENLIQTIQILKEKGLELKPDIIIDHWYAFSKNERLPFSDFCAKYKLDI